MIFFTFKWSSLWRKNKSSIFKENLTNRIIYKNEDMVVQQTSLRWDKIGHYLSFAVRRMRTNESRTPQEKTCVEFCSICKKITSISWDGECDCRQSVLIQSSLLKCLNLNGASFVCIPSALQLTRNKCIFIEVKLVIGSNTIQNKCKSEWQNVITLDLSLSYSKLWVWFLCLCIPDKNRSRISSKYHTAFIHENLRIGFLNKLDCPVFYKKPYQRKDFLPKC
jgi:hypothetical protein